MRGMIGIMVLCMVFAGSTAVLADDWGSWDSDDSWEHDGWEEDPWDGSAADAKVSGYAESTALLMLPRTAELDELRGGFQQLLRLRGRFQPAQAVSVTLEAEYLEQWGAAHPKARREIVGIEGGELLQQGISLDYVYADSAFGPVDLRIGRQPLAWGSAYAFNPTNLMNPSTLAGLAGIEPPGITAVAPSITLGTQWGVEGYLGFEDRNRQLKAVSDLSRLDTLPFGVRGRGYIGMWDFSLGAARTAVYDSSGDQVITDHYAAVEAAGSVGQMMVYGETAIRLGGKGWTLKRSVDGAVGFRTDLGESAAVQIEYHRRGRGGGDPDAYDQQARLMGEPAGRDYLAVISDLVLLNDRIQAVLAGLLNLNDQSIVLMPELTYEAADDIALTLGGVVFAGPKNSEFDGRFSSYDTGRPQMTVSAIWYF